MAWPVTDYTRPWDSLNADEKRLFARMAEVYAGFLAHADHHIGRLLDYLEENGELDNTMIVVVSDNGASGEGGPNGSVNEMKFANGIPDDLADNLAQIDELGGPQTYNHYPTGWAMAFNTPFKMWKRYEFNGGTADPCIISWPAGIKARGEIRDQYHHAVDIVPTILDVLGVDAPETIKGHVQSPFDGVSMRASFDDAVQRRQRGRPSSTPCSGSRSIWHEGWKAVTTHPVIVRLGPLQRRRMGALPHRRRPGRDPQPGRRAPRQGSRAGEPLVRRGRGQRGVPARRPFGDRDRQHPPPPAHRPPGPVRVPARDRARPGVAGGQHARPLVRDRRAGRHPRPRRRGRAVRLRVTLRRPRPVREGQPAGITSTTSSGPSRKSSDPRTSRPATT